MMTVSYQLQFDELKTHFLPKKKTLQKTKLNNSTETPIIWTEIAGLLEGQQNFTFFFVVLMRRRWAIHKNARTRASYSRLRSEPHTFRRLLFLFSLQPRWFDSPFDHVLVWSGAIVQISARYSAMLMSKNATARLHSRLILWFIKIHPPSAFKANTRPSHEQCGLNIRARAHGKKAHAQNAFPSAT